MQSIKDTFVKFFRFIFVDGKIGRLRFFLLNLTISIAAILITLGAGFILALRDMGESLLESTDGRSPMTLFVVLSILIMV